MDGFWSVSTCLLALRKAGSGKNMALRAGLGPRVGFLPPPGEKSSRAQGTSLKLAVSCPWGCLEMLELPPESALP